MPGATDGSMPVGSGRFRDHAQDSSGVLGMSFSSPLALSEEGCVAHTQGEHDGEEVALLAQLKLPLATRSKRIPTLHSLPCSPVGRTDIPSSLYTISPRGSCDLLFLLATNAYSAGFWRSSMINL